MSVIDTKSALQRFAKAILRNREQVGAVVHGRLPEGLTITVQRVAGTDSQHRCRLVLSHPDRWPSAEEVQACCIVFNVPPWFAQQQSRQSAVHPKSGRRIHSYIVELAWRERTETEAYHDNHSN